MRVLVLNPGSSTLKYRLVEVADDSTHVLASHLVDHLTSESLADATQQAIDHVRMHGIDAVGCRVVHGGERFAEPTLVTPDVLATIRELGRLAPLHNPASAMVLDRVQSALPNVPIVAVFDTAYHRTIPYVAALYALPWSIAQEKGLRRYGFHGTSHQYVAGRLRACAGGTKHITCHLGNGASICAIKEGKSLDTSMGLTPLEGLMMGTRSGDVDPGLVLHLLRHERRSVDEVEHLLNQQSGLFGIAGHADLRDVEAAAKAGDTRAVLAIEMFAYRVRKYIGAYAAVLEGVDAIAFTAGIGEHSAAMRARICTPLCWLGVHLDVHANAQSGNGERRISTADSPVTVWVIPTDEEAFLARETVAIVTGKDRVCTR